MRHPAHARLAIVVAVLVPVLWLAACRPLARPSGPPESLPPLPTVPVSGSGASPSAEPAVLVGAGDIAECGDDDDESTAELVEAIPGTVIAVGDTVYPDGSERDYRDCYEPSWGRFRDRTRPVPGNHEYATPGARGYLDYFGPAARPEGTTWYAWDAGAWRVIVLDSNCGEVGGCDADSPQGRWLAEELATSAAPCTLALWHHPLFSSGEHGGREAVRPFWEQLQDAGAELVVAAHEHSYERFAAQRADGTPDESRGIRQLVVGTGGARLRGFPTALPTSEVRGAGTFGVVRLALLPGRYQWDFIPVAGSTFRDHGTGTCH